MPVSVRDAGAWRTPNSVFARVAGVWVRVNLVYTRVGGVWVSSFADVFNLVIASSINGDTNLRSLAVSAGWNQISRVVVTINSGVIITGSGFSNAVTINGSFPNGITLINNGQIIGRGGNGGAGGTARGDLQIAYGGAAGSPGGTALLAQVPVTVVNNGVIAGGGGGGGGGGSAVANRYITYSDPGGGGGK